MSTLGIALTEDITGVRAVLGEGGGVREEQGAS